MTVAMSEQLVKLQTDLSSGTPQSVTQDWLAECDPSATYTVVNPPWRWLTALTAAWTELETDPAELPMLRVVAPRGTLVNLRQQFIPGSRAAALVEADSLALREHPDAEAETPLIGTNGSVFAPLLLGGSAAIVRVEAGSFVETARSEIEELWNGGESFSLRTPGIDRLRESMTNEFGESVTEEFDAALAAAAEELHGDAFDAVTASVIVAAANQNLHYDVSRWGEEIKLASKATFSRRKGQLEDAGVVTTEKVPVEMGRPRQRLLLTEEARETQEAEGTAAVVIEQLS